MNKIVLSTALCATMMMASQTVHQHKTSNDTSHSLLTPKISLTIDGSYVKRAGTNNDESSHLEVDGVSYGLLGTHTHSGNKHTALNSFEGFNINYAELYIANKVDKYIELEGLFHFSEDGVEVEEAFITTHVQNYGLKVKAGRINSNFGYLNEHHHRSYDFNDKPLVYDSFLGMHGINEVGLQIQYTTHFSKHLMVGTEILSGDNEYMFGNETIKNGDDILAEGKDGVTLGVAYIKTSFDIAHTNILTGISYTSGTSRINHLDEHKTAFSGDSKVYGFDFVAKHHINSHSFIKLQSEILYRDMDGTEIELDGNSVSKESLSKKQAGAYLQAVYTPNKSWSMGLRFDSIFKNEIVKDHHHEEKPEDLNKYSSIVEYRTSPNAKFRLQYNHNNAFTKHENGHEKRVKVDTFMLSANISIGDSSHH
jgi:hypothetical protein